MESAVIKHRMHGVNLFVLLTRRSSKFSPSEYHLLGHTTLSWCDISFIRIRFALVCVGCCIHLSFMTTQAHQRILSFNWILYRIHSPDTKFLIDYILWWATLDPLTYFCFWIPSIWMIIF